MKLPNTVQSLLSSGTSQHTKGKPQNMIIFLCYIKILPHNSRFLLEQCQVWLPDFLTLHLQARQQILNKQHNDFSKTNVPPH